MNAILLKNVKQKLTPSSPISARPNCDAESLRVANLNLDEPTEQEIGRIADEIYREFPVAKVLAAPRPEDVTARVQQLYNTNQETQEFVRRDVYRATADMFIQIAHWNIDVGIEGDPGTAPVLACTQLVRELSAETSQILSFPTGKKVKALPMNLADRRHVKPLDLMERDVRDHWRKESLKYVRHVCDTLHKGFRAKIFGGTDREAFEVWYWYFLHHIKQQQTHVDKTVKRGATFLVGRNRLDTVIDTRIDRAGILICHQIEHTHGLTKAEVLSIDDAHQQKVVMPDRVLSVLAAIPTVLRKHIGILTGDRVVERPRILDSKTAQWKDTKSQQHVEQRIVATYDPGVLLFGRVLTGWDQRDVATGQVKKTEQVRQLLSSDYWAVRAVLAAFVVLELFMAVRFILMGYLATALVHVLLFAMATALCFRFDPFKDRQKIRSLPGEELQAWADKAVTGTAINLGLLAGLWLVGHRMMSKFVDPVWQIGVDLGWYLAAAGAAVVVLLAFGLNGLKK